jgi:hypothetical protein
MTLVLNRLGVVLLPYSLRLGPYGYGRAIFGPSLS